MQSTKIVLFLLVAVLVLSFSLSVKAANRELSGYVYSEDAGWISLSCINTNSCASIYYKVTVDSNGNLSGYGFSQNDGWINFNPNYGGVGLNSNGVTSGWAFSETQNWLNIDGAKIISTNDLQNTILSTSDITTSSLNTLCNKFLSVDECSSISN